MLISMALSCRFWLNSGRNSKFFSISDLLPASSPDFLQEHWSSPLKGSEWCYHDMYTKLWIFWRHEITIVGCCCDQFFTMISWQQTFFLKNNTKTIPWHVQNYNILLIVVCLLQLILLRNHSKSMLLQLIPNPIVKIT